MRGFTSLSENLDPDTVVKMLNTYYTIMVEVINSYKGTVVQFVGDEIFAVFWAPLAIEDCVERALRCALAMVERLKDINAKIANYSILFGESIYKNAHHLVITWALPAMLLNGKKTEIKVFEVLGLREDSPIK